MGRQEELMLEFAELSRAVQESGFRGRFRLGIKFTDTVPERKQHGEYRIHRAWNPCSYKETREMIDWCLLMEKLFNNIAPHKLMTIFGEHLKPRAA